MGIKEEYKNYFQNPEGCNDYNKFKEILYGKEDSLVLELFNYIKQNIDFSKKDSLRICDVGGGDGSRVLKLSKFLKDIYPNLDIHLTLIEQSKKYILTNKNDLDEIFCSVRLIPTEFEIFHSKDAFDLVLSIHSIFCIKNDKILDKVLDLTSKTGNLIFITNENDSFLAVIKEKLDKNYAEKRFEVNNLIKYLDNRKCTFRKINFNTIFSLDDAKRSTILDWLDLGKFKCRSNEEKEEIFDLVDSFTSDGDIVEKEAIIHVSR